MKKYNFSAGPCVLPQSVFEKASRAVLDFDGSGLSVLEISHRSPAFVDVMEEARSLALELLGLKDKGYTALFLHGGASTQFLMTAYNLLDTKAAYLDTGKWSSKAIKEAELFGDVNTVASSSDADYNYIPKEYTIPGDVDYFHCTSNNTIYGTQMKEFPELDVPMICDMSSDIFSRDIDYSKFDLIYAGAQKNMGPAGTTLVVLKDEILGKVNRAIPTMMDYKTHIKKDSAFNTPSVYAVYVTMLTLRWLKEQGGVKIIEKQNEEKAKFLYSEIDMNPLFEGFTKQEDRSAMNATFTLKNQNLKERFDKFWKEAGINGLKGHRSVGGYRASMYNALSLESVETLVEVMNELQRKA